MQRLIERLRRERGATAVVFAFLAIPLLGGVALAVDVGALYFEKAQLQNGADAAALRVALACAAVEETAPDPCVVGSTALNGTADTSADENANDDGGADASATFRNGRNEVTVMTTTRTDDGETALRHPLASLIGINPTTVGASATAEWGSVYSGTTLALAIDQCEFEQFGPESSNPLTAGAQIVLRYDENAQKTPGCADARGGFGWLVSPEQDCLVELHVESTSEVIEGVLDGETGNNAKKSGCTSSMLDAYVLSGEPILVPIYYDVDGNGAGTAYRIKFFASVKLLDYKIQGGQKIEAPTNGGGGNGGGNGGGGNGGGGNGGNGGGGGGGNDLCSGNCRGIYVQFIEWVSVSDLDVTLGGSGPAGSADGVQIIAGPRP